MVHIPAKFRENTAMRFSNYSAKPKRDGQMDGGRLNISRHGPSARREIINGQIKLNNCRIILQSTCISIKLTNENKFTLIMILTPLLTYQHLSVAYCLIPLAR